MGFLGTVLHTAVLTGRLLLQNRLYWVLLLALLATAVLAAALGADPPRDIGGRQLYAILCWWLVANVLVPWTTMYFAVQAVHGDIEDRTFQYLFLRPVSRAAILLGKWLAVAVLAGATAAVGAVLVFAGAALHGALWPVGLEVELPVTFALAGLLTAVASAAVATLFATRFRWPLVWSTAYIVAAQFFLANLPARASIRTITVGDPVRRFVFDGIDPDRRLARAMWPSERHWDPELIGTPLLDLLWIVAVCLGLALLSYTRSEYDSRPRE